MGKDIDYEPGDIPDVEAESYMAKKSTVASTPAAFDEMLPALREVATKIRDLFEPQSDCSIVKRHDVGKLIVSVLESEAEYGSMPVQQLAAFLGKSDMELYGYRNVAAVYSRDEIAKLAHRQMASGDRLQWGHLTALSEIARNPDRRKFEDLTFASSWSVRELRKMMLPGGQIANLRIDPTHHDLKGFRLAEGQVLHLIDEDGEKLILTIKGLLADESPSDLGGTADLGQVADSIDGWLILCVDDRCVRGLAIEVYDSLNGLVRSLREWDPMGKFAPADAFIMLSALGAIELKPEFLKPTARRQLGT